MDDVVSLLEYIAFASPGHQRIPIFGHNEEQRHSCELSLTRDKVDEIRKI
jgi:hypothetical protein